MTWLGRTGQAVIIVALMLVLLIMRPPLFISLTAFIGAALYLVEFGYNVWNGRS